MADTPHVPAVTPVEVLAIVGIFGISSIAAYFIREHAALILVATPVTLGTLLTFLRSIRTEAAAAAAKMVAEQSVEQVKELEIKVDGRLSQILELTATAARAEGRDSQRAEHDLREAGKPADPPAIQQVEVVNTEESPANVKSVEPEEDPPPTEVKIVNEPKDPVPTTPVKKPPIQPS